MPKRSNPKLRSHYAPFSPDQTLASFLLHRYAFEGTNHIGKPITKDYAEQVRHVIDSHKAPIPTILEIPSKEKPYDPEKDSLLKRAKYIVSFDYKCLTQPFRDMFGGEA